MARPFNAPAALNISYQISEGSFTSRNVVDGDWKFRNLKQKFRNLYLKLQKYINIFLIFVEYFRIFTSLHRVRYSWLDSVVQSIIYHRFNWELVLFVTVPGKSVYTYACVLQYFIHNACSCRGGSCKGSCLVGSILP